MLLNILLGFYLASVIAYIISFILICAKCDVDYNKRLNKLKSIEGYKPPEPVKYTLTDEVFAWAKRFIEAFTPIYNTVLVVNAIYNYQDIVDNAVFKRLHPYVFE